MTTAQWLEAVRDAERRGELLTAVDLAEQGLAEHPGELTLRHGAVLALARAGATDEAGRRFAAYGLADVAEEDVAALGARIAKDAALAAPGEERRRLATAAADDYARVHAASGGYYPAINAATLRLVAGDPPAARELARTVLGLLDAADEESYWAAATEAEARLLLGEESAARDALERAARLAGGDHGALASTRRQLRLVCDLTGVDAALLDPLAGPPVVHFCGHIVAPDGAGGRFVAGDVETAAARIEAEVAHHAPGYAYGALAAGADILWAEALLERGCELHVVLPFNRDEFVATSVAPAGDDWTARFERCLARARTVSYATVDAFLGDDVLFRYGTELAMGKAVLRARYLDAEARQLALWDGRPGAGAAGTAIDVERWRATGRPATIVAPGNGRPPAPAAAAGAESSGRVVRAMLFADVKGFSKLTDEQLPRFTEHVLGACAEVLARQGDDLVCRNTWGDALYVALLDPSAGARCALGLQDAMAALDLAALGLPSHLALRLGAHVGPVFPAVDPVLQEATVIGSHVSRTARIEPVTPPGEVYVTEPFAAALALDGDPALLCDYVGHLPAAKDFGRLRMYRLHRSGA